MDEETRKQMHLSQNAIVDLGGGIEILKKNLTHYNERTHRLEKLILGIYERISILEKK